MVTKYHKYSDYPVQTDLKLNVDPGEKKSTQVTGLLNPLLREILNQSSNMISADTDINPILACDG